MALVSIGAGAGVPASFLRAPLEPLGVFGDPVVLLAFGSFRVSISSPSSPVSCRRLASHRNTESRPS